MATPYSVIYEGVLDSIKSYNLQSKLPTEDREMILYRLLRKSIIQTQKFSGYNLSSRDDSLQQFNNDLPEEIIEILVQGCLAFWLDDKVLDEEKTKNRLGSADYNQYSPGNLLKELKALRTDFRKEFKLDAIDYSIRNR